MLELKDRNPKLKVLASLGGSAVGMQAILAAKRRCCGHGFGFAVPRAPTAH